MCNSLAFPDLALLVSPDDGFSHLFDLSTLHELSNFHVTLHAMRFPVAPFTKMLTSIIDAQSRLRSLALSLFTWRFWRFGETDVERWDTVDTTLVRLSRGIKERFDAGLAIRVIVNLLEYGPHDVRDILPRLGGRGLVRLLRDGDSTLELPL